MEIQNIIATSIISIVFFLCMYPIVKMHGKKSYRQSSFWLCIGFILLTGGQAFHVRDNNKQNQIQDAKIDLLSTQLQAIRMDNLCQ